MNNCIIQGKITKISEVKFYYYNLKAVLSIWININCNINNTMECKIYDENIDILLDKYILNDICILSGSLRKKSKYENNGNDYLKVLEIF